MQWKFDTRDVNSREILFSGLKAQIPGLVQVSIWTFVIRLAKQWQLVRPGSIATGWFADPATGGGGGGAATADKPRQRATTPAAVTVAQSRVAGGCSQVAGEALWQWSPSEGVSTAVVHYSAIWLQFQGLNDGRRCVSGHRTRQVDF